MRRGEDPRWGGVIEALEAVADASADGAVAALRAARTSIGRWPRTDAGSRALEATIACADAGAWGAPDADPADWLAALVRWRAATARAAAAVTITTAHRSKGLEWDVVHVPGQVLGTFPRTVDDEERRLAYVAWTRARERLHLYRPSPTAPAPFLTEGHVKELVAVQADLASLAAHPASAGSLAARWARADAERRLGPLGGWVEAR